MTIKNLWTEYDGKGFSAEHANYAERATADEVGNDIQATYATKTENDGKADKVASATSGNFAGLDANGNLIDSGSKASDFLQEERVVYIEGTIASGPGGFVVTCSTTYNEITELLRSGKVPVCKFAMPSSQFNQAWYFYYHITTTSKHSFGSMDVAPSYGENASYASCVYVETNNSWHFLELANYDREYWNRLLARKQNIISDLETIRSGAAAGATAVQPDDLAAVATSGSYNDLSDKPSIPADNVLILQDNGFNRALVKAAWDAHKIVQAWSGTPPFRTRLTKVETPDADTEVYHFTAIVPVNNNKSVLHPTWRVFDSQYIYTISTGTYAHGGDSKDIVSPVQPDWLQSDETALDYIKGKPNLALKENVANKTETVRQSGSADNTHYPSEAAVRSAIDTAVSSAYKAAGTKRAAELTSSLLVAANEGSVYNITEAGTTDNNFVDGAGKTINVGDNVGVCKVGNDYKFDLLSGFVDLSDYLTKTGNVSNTTSTFTKNASDNSGMVSGSKLSALFTTISNFFASLKALAFKATVGTSDIDDNAITAAKVKDNETLPVNISGNASSATNLAPGGTSGQYLKSNGSGAPTWEDLPQGFISTDTDSAAFNGDTKIATGFSNNKIHLNTASKLWTYIQDRISSVLGLTINSYGGKAAAASVADRANRAIDANSADSVDWADVTNKPATIYIGDYGTTTYSKWYSEWSAGKALFCRLSVTGGYVYYALDMIGRQNKDPITFVRAIGQGSDDFVVNGIVCNTDNSYTTIQSHIAGTTGTYTGLTVGMAKSVGNTSGSDAVALTTAGLGVTNGTKTVSAGNGVVSASDGFIGNLSGNAATATTADVLQDNTISNKTVGATTSAQASASDYVAMWVENTIVKVHTNKFTAYAAHRDAAGNGIAATYQRKDAIGVGNTTWTRTDEFLLPSSGTVQTSISVGLVSSGTIAMVNLIINTTNSGTVSGGSSISGPVVLTVMLRDDNNTSTIYDQQVFYTEQPQTLSIPLVAYYSGSANHTMHVCVKMETASGYWKGGISGKVLYINR